MDLITMTTLENIFVCLLDMHWASGFIAYFQSYVLANFYAAHLFLHLQKELPSLDQKISQGNFAPIKQWLSHHVFSCGAAVPSEELLTSLTGETLSPKPYIDYIRTKYSELYNL